MVRVLTSGLKKKSIFRFFLFFLKFSFIILILKYTTTSQENFKKTKGFLEKSFLKALNKKKLWNFSILDISKLNWIINLKRCGASSWCSASWNTVEVEVEVEVEAEEVHKAEEEGGYGYWVSPYKRNWEKSLRQKN